MYLPHGTIGMDQQTLSKLNPMLFVHGMTGLPNAVVITGGLCPLQDEAIEFARAISVAGVHVIHEHVPNAVQWTMGVWRIRIR